MDRSERKLRLIARKDELDVMQGELRRVAGELSIDTVAAFVSRIRTCGGVIVCQSAPETFNPVEAARTIAESLVFTFDSLTSVVAVARERADEMNKAALTVTRFARNAILDKVKEEIGKVTKELGEIAAGEFDEQLAADEKKDPTRA